ncbi:MAG: DNA topoisomerase (ATP-hydrolyzing) [Desulfomonilaceae bacterium]|nr:DNA topoisomerase (ATP-hydrolyzing) [Desulfomonilaceae bacterium]
MQQSLSPQGKGLVETALHDEVEKRYLAYALSTIVSRALPDVRDGLKPVHRRILYAMHGMRLGDASRMRKSAAVVGEVIGKFHPHGDQAAYDSLVRMAQDFSLRYPLVEGTGNFGSVDGDSPAAMRYTETRLSPFAGLLLREIDQGTTKFSPTYDGMGQEPDVLPAAMPNLLLNGSSGIAVGMSCSFPPHNLREVISACRAAIKSPDLDTRGLLKHIKGPDFPTGGEILDQPDRLAEIYATGHGSVTVRGTFELEDQGRGRAHLIVTSIPYSINKSRLIERIATLIRDKKLKHVHDVRDESTQDVRIVLELKGADVKPDSVMAFLYKHTELQINFLINFIAITPQGVPDRLGLDRIVRYFLDFRYEKTVLRLQHRLDILQKRIHILEGFRILFQDLDKALAIIRSARSRQEAGQGLKDHFALDDEQVDAILEMRLYKLVGMEIGKLLEELTVKMREARELESDLASSERLWLIVDNELAEISRKFGDARRTGIVSEGEATALEYDPEEFVDHEDATVILSRQGWIRRIKSEVEDSSALKFREGDGLFGLVRVNTGRTVALFSNLGKVYVVRAIDIPATTGFGEPIGNLLGFGDGESVVGMIAPDPVQPEAEGTEPMDDVGTADASLDEDEVQFEMFHVPERTQEQPEVNLPTGPNHGVVVTRSGKGFRFDYEILREPTKRMGRKLVNLRGDDETLGVIPETGTLMATASTSGHLLVFPLEQIPVLSGPAQGVRIIKLKPGSSAVAFETGNPEDKLAVKPKKGKLKVMSMGGIPQANRAGQGKAYCSGIVSMERANDGVRQD